MKHDVNFLQVKSVTFPPQVFLQMQELAEARRRGKADRAAAEALAVSVEAGVYGEWGQRIAVDTPMIKTWTVSTVTFVATVCCTNDAELGKEFLARSSNVSMKKYTSKDGGLEGSTPRSC